MRRLLKKVFKLLELKKNASKEFFKPEGYESLKTKFDGLVKRIQSGNIKGKDKNSGHATSDKVGEDEEDRESDDDDDEPELEDDDSDADGGSSADQDPMIEEKKKNSAKGSTTKVVPEMQASGHKIRQDSSKMVFGPARPAGLITDSPQQVLYA